MDVFSMYQLDTIEDDCRLFFRGCASGTFDLEVLSNYQRRTAPSFHHLPFHRRLEFARAYCCTSHSRNHPDPVTLKFVLRQGRELQEDDIISSIHERQSILHMVTISLGRVSRRAGTSASSLTEAHLQTSLLDQWQNMVRDVVNKSTLDSLHHVEYVRHTYFASVNPLVTAKEWVGTPFISLLKGCFLEDFGGRKAEVGTVQEFLKIWQPGVSILLMRWLSELRRCGVDLMDYGKKEQSIWTCSWHSIVRSLDFEVTFNHWSSSKQVYVKDCLVVCLRGFDYGSAPEDWALRWEVDMEKIWGAAPEVSSSTHLMPGAWVD